MSCRLNWLIGYLRKGAEIFHKAPCFPSWCKNMEENSRRKHFINGQGEIVWEKKKSSLPYYNHIEMSGFKVSGIISYGADKNGFLKIMRHIVFPTLRVKPNRTRDHVKKNYKRSHENNIFIDGEILCDESPDYISVGAAVKIRSLSEKGVRIERVLFPGNYDPCFVERVSVRNISKDKLKIKIQCIDFAEKVKNAEGGNIFLVQSTYSSMGKKMDKDIHKTLKHGEECVFYQSYQGLRSLDKNRQNPSLELGRRNTFYKSLSRKMYLETPSVLLNTAFKMAKVRCCESIFDTKRGLMHSPGGGAYYAAMWTNDQCEYTNPVFPYIDYNKGIEQGKNCFNMFMKYMRRDMRKSIPSSIISEGDGTWSLVGDRGDAAMFTYGAARFALALGDRRVAENLWIGIRWGIGYSLKKLNRYGVVKSNTDELENRFPSGSANLLTSCLLYDGINSAVKLGEELGKEELFIKFLKRKAYDLHESIEGYFGRVISGYGTYRYYKGNSKLRSWIAAPLFTGIDHRKDGTLDALFSEDMWTEGGLRTEQGCDVFWDRAALYGLKGAFSCGDTERAFKKLIQYTEERLIGGHIPYPIEAYPEGNQRHLAGESALYLRIFTEGIFGIKVNSFSQFQCTPRLPEKWRGMALRRVCITGKIFDIEVMRIRENIELRVIQAGKIIYDNKGEETFVVNLKECVS